MSEPGNKRPRLPFGTTSFQRETKSRLEVRRNENNDNNADEDHENNTEYGDHPQAQRETKSHQSLEVWRNENNDNNADADHENNTENGDPQAPPPSAFSILSLMVLLSTCRENERNEEKNTNYQERKGGRLFPDLYCPICHQKLNRNRRSGEVSPEDHICTGKVNPRYYDMDKGVLVAVRMLCPYDPEKGILFTIYKKRKDAHAPGMNLGGFRRHIGLHKCKGACRSDICNFYRNNAYGEAEEYPNVKAIVDFYLRRVIAFVGEHEVIPTPVTETTELWIVGKWLSQSFIHQLLVSLQYVVGDNNVVLMSTKNSISQYSNYLGLKLGGTNAEIQRAVRYLEIFIRATPNLKLLKSGVERVPMNSDSNQNFLFEVSGHLFDTRAMAAFLQKLFDLKIHFTIPKLHLGKSYGNKSSLQLTLLQVTRDQIEEYRNFLLEFKKNNLPAEMKFSEQSGPPPAEMKFSEQSLNADLGPPRNRNRVYLLLEGQIFLSKLLGTLMQNESNRIFHICPGATHSEPTRLIMICRNAVVDTIKNLCLNFAIHCEILEESIATQEKSRHEKTVQEMMLRSPHIVVTLRKRDQSSPHPFAKLGTKYEELERFARKELGATLQISVPNPRVCQLKVFLGEESVLSSGRGRSHLPNLSDILHEVEKYAVVQPTDVNCQITLRNTSYARAPNVASRIIEVAKKVKIVVVETETGETANSVASLLSNGNHGQHVHKVLMAVHPNLTKHESNQIHEIAERNELLECVTIPAETRMHKESLLRGALVQHLRRQKSEAMPGESEIAMIYNANPVRNRPPQMCIQLIRKRDLDFSGFDRNV